MLREGLWKNRRLSYLRAGWGLARQSSVGLGKAELGGEAEKRLSQGLGVVRRVLQYSH